MSSQELTPSEARRAESLIARIQGISSCRIALNNGGQIAEIHVVATSGKPPKLVARDVESMLKAEMGLDVDYKKIGVVMFDQESSNTPDESLGASEPDALEEFPVEEHARRFAFHSVNLLISGSGRRAEVELSRDQDHFFGSCESDNPHGSAADVVAEATLRAIDEALESNIRLCLGKIQRVALGDREAMIVRVDLVENRETRALAGCSIVAGDENQTVVFATLDAVNRVLGKLSLNRSIEYKIR